MNTYPICDSPFSEIGAAQFRSVTEIVPKSPFLCVNRNSIRYDFGAGAKAIQYSVNIAYNLLLLAPFSLTPTPVLRIAEEKRVRQSSQTNTPKIWKKGCER